MPPLAAARASQSALCEFSGHGNAGRFVSSLLEMPNFGPKIAGHSLERNELRVVQFGDVNSETMMDRGHKSILGAM
jgi:hypothetical protein